MEDVQKTRLEAINEKISEHSYKLFKKEFDSGKKMLEDTEKMIDLSESNGVYNALVILFRSFGCDGYTLNVFIDKLQILNELLDLSSRDLSTAFFIVNERSLYLIEHLENVIRYVDARRNEIILSN